MSEENKTEELEKKAGEDAQVQSRAAGAETAKQAAPSEDEDDNISWEDALKRKKPLMPAQGQMLRPKAPHLRNKAKRAAIADTSIRRGRFGSRRY
jgi:hypothetical protein